MRSVTTMTIYDVEHYTDEERAAIIDGWPAHEREARAKGIPQLGSGRIFPISEDAIKIEPFPIPAHWFVLAGIDFGFDHPTAAAKIAWDKDADVIYVTHCYRKREATPVIHAGALKSWGIIPWSWPHDGNNDTAAGENLATQYRNQGLSFLPERATDEDGTNSVEAGLMDMLDRMQTERLKVFSNLNDWFEEFRLYHRKDGKIVKENDDILSATRYAIMMKRYAKQSIKKTAQKLQMNLGTLC